MVVGKWGKRLTWFVEKTVWVRTERMENVSVALDVGEGNLHAALCGRKTDTIQHVLLRKGSE